jgi:hypothetical protein
MAVKEETQEGNKRCRSRKIRGRQEGNEKAMRRQEEEAGGQGGGKKAKGSNEEAGGGRRNKELKAENSQWVGSNGHFIHQIFQTAKQAAPVSIVVDNLGHTACPSRRRCHLSDSVNSQTSKRLQNGQVVVAPWLHTDSQPN